MLFLILFFIVCIMFIIGLGVLDIAHITPDDTEQIKTMVEWEFQKDNLKACPSYEDVEIYLKNLDKSIQVSLVTAHKVIGSTYIADDMFKIVLLYDWLEKRLNQKERKQK